MASGPSAEVQSRLHPFIKQVPAPPMPPTPPGSVGGSPPPTFIAPASAGALPSDHLPNGTGAGPSSSSSYALPSSVQLTSPNMLDAGPSRRHHFESPPTKQHFALATGQAQYTDGEGPFRAAAAGQDPARPRGGRRLEYEPGWEGTLSAGVTALLARVRTAWASVDHSLLDGGGGGNGAGSPGSRPSSDPVVILVRRLALLSRRVSWSSIRFGLLCLVWYSTSALSSNTGKVILNRFRYPVTLTFIQFGFVAGWCALFVGVREGVVNGKFAGNGGLGGVRGAINLLGLKRPSRTALLEMFVMSLFQIAGHVFSSMAIARVPVSTVHTIKALSPLFTVMAYAGLFGVRYSPATYTSLLPLTLGVMLACSFDLRANATGLICALGSTVVFVSQNIFGKKLLPKESDGPSIKAAASATGAGPKMDKLSLLFYSSGMAFLLMIPIWLWSDGGALVSSWFSTSYDAAKHAPSGAGSALALVFFFVCNGSVHFAQCILAFSILARTSPVTYSIASLIKRIAVICIAIVWFGQQTSIVQGLGMVMTFGGLWMYNRAKGDVDKGERKRGQVERKADLLLPSNKEDARILDGYSDSSRAVSPMPLFAGAAYSQSLSSSRPVANGFAGSGLRPSTALSPNVHPSPFSAVPRNVPTSTSIPASSPPLGPPPSSNPALASAAAARGRGLLAHPSHSSSPPLAHNPTFEPSAVDGLASGAQTRAADAPPKRRGPSVSLERPGQLVGGVR